MCMTRNWGFWSICDVVACTATATRKSQMTITRTLWDEVTWLGHPSRCAIDSGRACRYSNVTIVRSATDGCAARYTCCMRSRTLPRCAKHQELYGCTDVVCNCCWLMLHSVHDIPHPIIALVALLQRHVTTPDAVTDTDTQSSFLQFSYKYTRRRASWKPHNGNYDCSTEFELFMQGGPIKNCTLNSRAILFFKIYF